MHSYILYTLIAVTSADFIAEFLSSHVARSSVLVVSAYHMLYNLLSLILLVVDYKVTKGTTLKNTFGWVRIKVLGFMVNTLFLLALCFAECVEAVQTMVHASHEDTEPKYPILLLFLGCINLALNIICFFFIGGYTHHQGCSLIIQGNKEVELNTSSTKNTENINLSDNTKIVERSEYNENWRQSHKVVDFARDISSCSVVIGCSCVILFMGGPLLKYADAILTIVLVSLLMRTTYPFIKESGLILLQSIPSYINVEGLTKRLLNKFPEIQNIHDLHVWRLTTSEVIATVHITLIFPGTYTVIEKKLNQFFEAEGISSVTIQPEFTHEFNSLRADCILLCTSNKCGPLTCCGLQAKNKQEGATQTSCIANPINSNEIISPHYDYREIMYLVETEV